MLAAVAEGFTHAADHIRIKGSRCRAGCGKTDRLDAVVDAEMVRFLILLAQAVGTVAHHGAGDSQPFHGLGMPEIVAGTQARLFLQRHLGDQSFDIHLFILLFHMFIVPGNMQTFSFLPILWHPRKPAVNRLFAPEGIRGLLHDLLAVFFVEISRILDHTEQENSVVALHIIPALAIV